MEEKTLLTPVDFTEVSEYAIVHAVEMAKSINAKVILLHIVKDGSEIKKARQKLQVHMDELSEKYPDVTIQSIIRIGDIYNDVSNAAIENGAHLIIMGTHGMKGAQFLTGSRALKVVGDSEVPFLIIQKGLPDFSGIDNILVPLTLEKYTKQKLSHVKFIAKYFDSKAILTVPKEKDEFLRNKLTRDLKYSEQYFKEAGIPYEGFEVDGKNEVDSYINLVDKYNIDLIVVMNHSEGLFPAIGNSVQEIITNKKKVPIFLINPLSTSSISVLGNYSGGD